MGPDQPIYTLRRPGEKLTTRPYTNEEYDALADEYIQAMRTRQPHGPYFISGMCEGAIIAFTIAKQLEAAGEKVAVLTIMDAWVRENSRSRVRSRYNRYQRRLRAITRSAPKEAWRILGTAARNRLTWLIHGKSELQRIHEQVYWPGENFAPPKILSRITLIRVPEQIDLYYQDPLLGWGARTHSGVDVITVISKHRELLREPAVREVADHLARAIDQALKPAKREQGLQHVT